jgi:RNA polymerase sigma-70 factor (ECF subfamily)
MHVERPNRQDQDQRNIEFVRLLAAHELRLSVYVHTLVPLWNDAEDVLQNTKVRLWEQFDQFQPGTDFAAWAFTVAGYMIRTYRKQCHRQRLCFADNLLQKIAAETSPADSAGEDRIAALVECVRALGDTSRQLLRLFYTDRQRVKDIARQLGQAPTATYQALSRIRRSLSECVEKRLHEEEGR